MLPARYAITAARTLHRENLQLHGRKNNISLLVHVPPANTEGGGVVVHSAVILLQTYFLRLYCGVRLSITVKSLWGLQSRTSLWFSTPVQRTSGCRHPTVSAKHVVHEHHTELHTKHYTLQYTTHQGSLRVRAAWQHGFSLLLTVIRSSVFVYVCVHSVAQAFQGIWVNFVSSWRSDVWHSLRIRTPAGSHGQRHTEGSFYSTL